MDVQCSVCGGTDFRHARVLWGGLIAEWQLAPEEVAYVDRQQGSCCTRCGSNLRSIALADAMLAGFAPGVAITFAQFTTTPLAQSLRVLEINEAGMLSPVLKTLPGHVLAQYPAVDMHAMPYPDGTFDLVVHSDTLEHVAQPIRALAECRRVLKPGGLLCFTVPTIVDRMTRNRTGLPPSYHGVPGTDAGDYTVHTEFGADAWTYVLKAGFRAVQVHAVDYPSATALSARA